MRIAVTGGTGFVGSHFIDTALAAGHEVRALTRRPQPDRTGVTWIPGSLSDRDGLRNLVDPCDAMVHIAGIHSNPVTFIKFFYSVRKKL